MPHCFSFRIKLQGTNTNNVILMYINGRFTKVVLKWKLYGEIVPTEAWETSVPASLDLFPFTGAVNVKVAFRNIGNSIQVMFCVTETWQNSYSQRKVFFFFNLQSSFIKRSSFLVLSTQMVDPKIHFHNWGWNSVIEYDVRLETFTFLLTHEMELKLKVSDRQLQYANFAFVNLCYSYWWY